jgi:ankyrin repeat protein
VVERGGKTYTNLLKVAKDNLGPLCEAAMSAAKPADPRSLKFNSSDALLQVLCCVAFCGHDANNFSSLTRAFRGDEVLWGCIKDRRGQGGMTALMACSITGDLARVRWLLERGANVNAQAEDGYTSLSQACWNGRLEIVRELLGHGANVNATLTIRGDTSLMSASQQGHLEVVRELLGRGANVNAAQTDCGWTSLMSACQKGHLEVVRELLGRGANVNATLASTGTTSLMETCWAGHLEVVREQLVRGAHVNAAQAGTGMTSLMIACQQGHHDVARLLVEHKADRFLLDENGRTARQLIKLELRGLLGPDFP